MAVSALVTSSRRQVNLGGPLAEGGQGIIFEVRGDARVVCKRYKESELAEDASLPERLQAMLRLQPAAEWSDPDRSEVMLAWPIDTVYEDGRFVGFLMPRIDWGRSARLLRVWDPSDREEAEAPNEWLRDLQWCDLVTTGANLASGLEALHAAGVVIGDFNDANIAVTPEGRVTFFDCDSMQLFDEAGGRQFLCRVTRPEFTAPELLGQNLRATWRPRSSDLFALAVHLHQLLLQGEHPFRGQWNGAGDPPREQVLARQGLWIHAGFPELSPRPSAVGLELLPHEFGTLFYRAFVEGAEDPERRPSATEWADALDALRSDLVQCRAVDHHWYASSYSQCPWCWQARRMVTRAASVSARPVTPRPQLAPPAAHAAAGHRAGRRFWPFGRSG